MPKVDLLGIEPIKVSTDIKSYSMLFYSESKFGKSTFVNDLFGDRVLNIMTEKRYSALEGAKVVYVPDWATFKSVLKELKKPEVNAMYDAISIDTVENLYDSLNKYVAGQYGEQFVGDDKSIGFGQDYTRMDNVWKRTMKEVESLDYTSIFVSHVQDKIDSIPIVDVDEKTHIVGGNKTTDKNGKEVIEFTKHQASLREKALGVITKMVDNILFGEIVIGSDNEQHRVIHLRGTLQYDAGTTFKDVPDTIQFSAKAYKDAVDKALGKYENTTDDTIRHSDIKETEYDFDDIMGYAKELAMAFHEAGKMGEVTKITDKELGKGVQVGSLDETRVEELDVVTNAMHDKALELGLVKA